MSLTGGNIDNPLELVQKTYHLQTTTITNHENPSQSRSSIAKVSTHQPSRKTSVHDIHETNRNDLNKMLMEIQENLSRLKVLLETMNSVMTIREEFFKLKDQIFKKIIEFISKLANESGKRGSISSKLSSSNLSSIHPQHLVYCIEYFRNELLKAQYLFNSLTISSSIGSATLNSIVIKSIYHLNLDQQISSNNEDKQNLEDLIQIKKDINNLEDHIYILNQRYYTQIPDWHGSTINIRGTLPNSEGLNLHRLRVGAFNYKLSTTSSVGSNENSNICNRFYRKCQMICCMCHTNYI